MKLKQYNIKFLGAFIESLFTALPFLSIINFLSIITVLYTTVREYLIEYVPWLTLGTFVGIMIVLVVVSMILIYVFILPSLWTFRGSQMNKFESDIMEELKKVRKELKELKKQ